MGTRSTIQITGNTFAKVYIHWDGYPEHMLPWLEAFTRDFAKNRGNDPLYGLAQLLRFAERHKRKYKLDPSKYTGYGIVPFEDDCGEEYRYIIDLGKNYKVSYKKA